jgi:DNA-directed RNA polymerase subunit K
MMQFTKYERARIIGARALQVSMGAPILISLTPQQMEDMNYSPIDIAKKEFDDQVLPLTIKRPLPVKL